MVHKNTQKLDLIIEALLTLRNVIETGHMYWSADDYIKQHKLPKVLSDGQKEKVQKIKELIDELSMTRLL